MALSRQLYLDVPAYDFEWNRWTTNKSSMFMWRAMEEKIPTTTASSNRGLNIPDVTCKICGAADETAAHVLIQCNFAKRAWESVVNWLHIPMINTEGGIKDLLLELNGLQRCKNMKVIHAIAIQTMWILWKNRNGKIFSNKQGDVQRIMIEIKEASYQGLKTRSKFSSITRQEWWDFNITL
ncbi:putative reverse transcriptase zinc-binding domain-containing protein [Helianthus annuus]|nr:putative reverse transcriptase zinc-binding domain-containing protein [Helianthus annuus]